MEKRQIQGPKHDYILPDGPIMRCIAKGQLMHVKHDSDGKLAKIRARMPKNTQPTR